MVKLRRYNLGDEIKTTKWKSPFIVEVIYKGYVVAVNRKQARLPVFLFIRTYSNQVYYGSSRFLKYGMDTKTEVKDFIDGVIVGNRSLGYDNCTPAKLILDKSEFMFNERRNQVRYE